MQPSTGGVYFSESSKCTIVFDVELVHYAKAHILYLFIDEAQNNKTKHIAWLQLLSMNATFGGGVFPLLNM